MEFYPCAKHTHFSKNHYEILMIVDDIFPTRLIQSSWIAFIWLQIVLKQVKFNVMTWLNIIWWLESIIKAKQQKQPFWLCIISYNILILVLQCNHQLMMMIQCYEKSQFTLLNCSRQVVTALVRKKARKCIFDYASKFDIKQTNSSSNSALWK